MKCDLLPAVDKQLLFFERWLPGHLAAIGNHHHRRIVKEIATPGLPPGLGPGLPLDPNPALIQGLVQGLIQEVPRPERISLERQIARLGVPLTIVSPGT
ncbi:hypothetical protein [Nocardia sp. CY41]|uniref:hypothetical protein n=1 Tax=Nocardia sp. CY41 TaxID=2608686 RepID=UPI00135759AE|nr:hypothetical protein [Nocardia sp. CY41]